MARYLPGAIPDCPRLAVKPGAAGPGSGPGPGPKPPRGYTLAEEGPAQVDGLSWRIYAAKWACGNDVIVQLLDAKGARVDERSEKAHCVAGNPEEGDLGESRVWSAGIEGDEGRPTRYVMFTFEEWASDTGCNGGVALCPTAGGIVEEALDGTCSCSPYQRQDGERHCGE